MIDPTERCRQSARFPPKGFEFHASLCHSSNLYHNILASTPEIRHTCIHMFID